MPLRWGRTTTRRCGRCSPLAAAAARRRAAEAALPARSSAIPDSSTRTSISAICRRDAAPFRLTRRHAYEQALARARAREASSTTSVLRSKDRGGARARAEACYREALRGQPDHRQAMAISRTCCAGTGNTRRRSLLRPISPASPMPTPRLWSTTGICVAAPPARRQHEPRASFRRAALLAPDDPPSLVDLGSALIEPLANSSRRPTYSRAQRPRSARPSPACVRSLAFVATALCAWDEASTRCMHTISEADRPKRRPRNACESSRDAVDADTAVRTAARRRAWTSTSASLPPAQPGSPAAWTARVRLRLGYVSSDFRNHAIAMPALRSLGAARPRAIRNDGVLHRPPRKLAIARPRSSAHSTVPRRTLTIRPQRTRSAFATTGSTCSSTSTGYARRAARSSRCGRRPCS